MEVTAITSNDVEFPFLDDCPIPKEYSPEAIKYNPYEIKAPFGCGKLFDEYG